MVYDNNTGICVQNDLSGGPTDIGEHGPQGEGNKVYDNNTYGIRAYPTYWYLATAVYGQSGPTMRASISPAAQRHQETWYYGNSMAS